MSKILAQLERQNISSKDIGLIIITHCHIDHFGSAAALKRLLGVPVLAHKLDAPYLRTGKANTDTMKPTKMGWHLFKRMIKDQTTVGFEPDIVLDNDEEYDLLQWGAGGKVIHTPGHTPGSLAVALDSGHVIVMDMLASGILLGGLMWRSKPKHPPFHDDLAALNKEL